LVTSLYWIVNAGQPLRDQVIASVWRMPSTKDASELEFADTFTTSGTTERRFGRLVLTERLSDMQTAAVAARRRVLVRCLSSIG
jgi:hypothetical protein